MVFINNNTTKAVDHGDGEHIYGRYPPPFVVGKLVWAKPRMRGSGVATTWDPFLCDTVQIRNSPLIAFSTRL